MIVAHRGPDDEGYLLWKPGESLQVLSGKDTSELTLKAYRYPHLGDEHRDWKIGLGHRRLSILDLSPGGHQPMVLNGPDLVISFNGEIYNYIEIRNELEKLGQHFHTGSDTEVILHAWSQWGVECLHHFNGMFAFILFDERREKLYAVRDRLGVKPLYYTNTSGYLAFASEVKQLRELPEYSFTLNQQIAYDYLRYGLVDHDEKTFEKNIYQLKPGNFIEVDVRSGDSRKVQWYSLKPKKWKGAEREAFETFYMLLKDSVRLRMRSDVPVASALSGGLDSSTIVCLMREVLKDDGHSEHLIKTITSCHEDKKYDEWEYAETIIKHVKAKPFKVFPSFEKLQQDLDRMLWHLDFPFGSTSQFSQWCVFEEARKQGLTVMIDGQGADEQLAGYGGNDMALYSGLLKKYKFVSLLNEAQAYKRNNGSWPYGFLLGSIQSNFPVTINWFPGKYRPLRNQPPQWLNHNGFQERVYGQRTLQEQLINQIQRQPLPSLLRYEDRNSMAFSVESRVPFMDYRLIEFTLGLPEKFVYKGGERKYILRKAFKNHVPGKVLERKDKMGFVSAEEKWVRDESQWFKSEVEKSVLENPSFFNHNESIQYSNGMTEGVENFNFDLWRMLCLGRWLRSINGI